MMAEGGREDARLLSDSLTFSLWPHRIAVALACATLALLFIGGLVTSKGAGLAVPDWPTTFGYNMFLYPWSKMIGNIFYEHSHRLAGAFVGLLTIALAIAIWFRERRRWLRWLGGLALALVIVQGILGGLRVVLLQHTLAIIHACFAQAFFALAVSLVYFTSAEWRNGPSAPPPGDGGRLGRLGAITTGLIYLQVVFGAVLRHTGERLDLHLLFAVLVAIHVVLLARRAMKTQSDSLKLAWPARSLGFLVLLQFLLGIASYIGKFTTAFRLPSDLLVGLTTAHLITGALMLAASLFITLRSYRVSTPPNSRLKTEVLTEQFSV